MNEITRRVRCAEASGRKTMAKLGMILAPSLLTCMRIHRSDTRRNQCHSACTLQGRWFWFYSGFASHVRARLSRHKRLCAHVTQRKSSELTIRTDHSSLCGARCCPCCRVHKLYGTHSIAALHVSVALPICQRGCPEILKDRQVIAQVQCGQWQDRRRKQGAGGTTNSGAAGTGAGISDDSR